MLSGVTGGANVTGRGGRGGMEDRTAMGETVVDGIRGRAEGMSGREDEAMDGVRKGGGQEGGRGRGR